MNEQQEMMIVNNSESGVRWIWSRLLFLPLSSCGILSNSLNLSEPQFLYLENGESNNLPVGIGG